MSSVDENEETKWSVLFAANDTLDLSQLTIDELKKAIDVPKELRGNPGATIGHQMEEIRKLVRRFVRSFVRSSCLASRSKS